MFWKSVRVLAAAMLVALGSACHKQPSTPSTPPQFRAYWVDAFGEGLYSPDEIDKLVSAAKAANMNAIIEHVGRRGDTSMRGCANNVASAFHPASPWSRNFLKETV